jgi:hypothetical protein
VQYIIVMGIFVITIILLLLAVAGIAIKLWAKKMENLQVPVPVKVLF